MKRIDLYLSECRVYDGAECLGARPEVDFDPIDAVDYVDRFDALRRVLPAATRPSLTVEVPDSWEITREHGVTNVEARAVDLLVAGVRRDFVPPAAVLAFARRGQYGLRIVAGRDPFGAEASELDIVRQASLFVTAPHPA